jgi:hypothetical protein
MSIIKNEIQMTSKVICFMLVVCILSSSCNTEADYKYIGQFTFEITNDSLFEQTVLSKGYECSIGGVHVQGIVFNGLPELDEHVDYIVSMYSPVENVYNNSYHVRNEAAGQRSKHPLEILKDTSIRTENMYLYSLRPKGKYRHLLP